MMTIRFACCLGLALGAGATSAAAQSAKEQDCAYQAQVVAAVQQARKDRVGEQNVRAHLAAGKPSWPENYTAMIPLITPWVYETPMRDIRNKDLGAAWQEICLQQ